MNLILLFCFLFLIIIYFLPNLIKSKKKECFKDPEQKDFDMTGSCVIRKSDALSRLANLTGQLINTFKDNTKSDNDIEDLTKHTGVYFTYTLLSNNNFEDNSDNGTFRLDNELGFTELETNVKMFRVLLYKIFSDYEKFKEPMTFEHINNVPDYEIRDTINPKRISLLDGKRDNNKIALKKIKHIALNGLPKFFPGMKKIHYDFRQMFSYEDIDISIFKEVFERDRDLEQKFNRHYKLDEKFRYLDKHLKLLFKKLLNRSFTNNHMLTPEDIGNFNIRLQDSLGNNLLPDITKVQGYYHLRKLIEHCKIKKNVNDFYKNLLDYLDQGSNNRKEIFQKMVKGYFYGEEKHIFKKWDRGNDNYKDMETMYSNINFDDQDSLTNNTFENMFDPFFIPGGDDDINDLEGTTYISSVNPPNCQAELVNLRNVKIVKN